MTNEEFDLMLAEVIDEHNTKPSQLLAVPGIYEVLSEFYNNEVLERDKINIHGLKKMPSQEAITKDNPTYIGESDGIDYYEHPRLGDEAPLIAKVNGVWYQSENWDL